ncbi:HAD-IIIC family phosphatase [Dinoroseobacter sp. S124A]|uniref:HAD-IIIC family phosphatase n=1 Tax=Dinoroseobacter sp. S124A TaxID=3415128 RepID=UPI003C7AAA9A
MSTTFEAVTSQVKLVIWDLDETFWQGTLSEGGMTELAAHTQMIKALADRGIMSSICSKNDLETARAALETLGVWEYFVFPHIDWTPKGQAIASILDRAQLRAPNVLFLDDNHMNLEEAGFFNKGLMCVQAQGDLSGLLDLPQLKGKDDRAHSRLAQYKMLETKQAEQAAGALDNMEFLRQSQIRVEIITEIEPHMDRVLELINRTNQLNFTKKRVETTAARAELDALLATSGVHAGLVRVTDRYGDYGIVGFFAARVKFNGTTVHHFCFSCRTLNMGVEQFVWRRIGAPEFAVKGPVANPLDEHDEIDWIAEASSSDQVFSEQDDRTLCLVGGCDLLQVSFYCGTNRHEFVNKEDRGYLVRYDDPGFFLNPRKPLKHDQTLKKFPSWSHQDMEALDTALASSDVVLLSLYYAVPGDTFFTFGGKEWGGEYLIKVPPRTLKKFIKSDQALWFAKSFYHRRYTLDESLELTRRSLERVMSLVAQNTQVFLLTAATKTGQQAERTGGMRHAYNAMCRTFCDGQAQAHLVDLDALLLEEDFQDSDHYTRAGYFKIASCVNDFMTQAEAQTGLSEVAAE